MRTGIIFLAILASCGCGKVTVNSSSPGFQVLPSTFGTFISVTVVQFPPGPWDLNTDPDLYVTVAKQDSLLGSTNVAVNATTDSTLSWALNFPQPFTRPRDSTPYTVTLLDEDLPDPPDTIATWIIRLSDHDLIPVYLEAPQTYVALNMRWL